MKKYEIMKLKFHRTVQNSTHYTKYVLKTNMDDQLLADCAREFQSTLQLKDKQVECLNYVLSGRDVIANLPVGYGKSIIYQLLPLLMKKKGLPKHVVLVLSPLNIIQEEQIRFLDGHGVTACRLPYTDEGTELDINGIVNGKYSVVFAHPEALLNTDCGKSLLHETSFIDVVAAVAVDECHIVEEWYVYKATVFNYCIFGEP